MSRSKDPLFQKSIEAVNKAGILLVFPIKNAKEPDSIWQHLHPKTKMRWEWTDDGDDKVANMWFRMKKLSDCKDVVYTKWYQGRATFFSRELYTAVLAIMQRSEKFPPMTREARTILRQLELNSPQSTKELKKAAHLQGRFYEGAFNKALKELFQRFLIVGFGEVDDGAFPSLAIGSTELIYENLWNEAKDLSTAEAMKTIDRYMPAGSKYRKFLDRFI